MWVLYLISSIFGLGFLFVLSGLILFIFGFGKSGDADETAEVLAGIGGVIMAFFLLGFLAVITSYSACNGNAAQVQLQPAWDATSGGCGVILPSGARAQWSWLNVTSDGHTISYTVEIPKDDS